MGSCVEIAVQVLYIGASNGENDDRLNRTCNAVNHKKVSGKKMYFVVQVSKKLYGLVVSHSGETKFDMKSCHVKSLLANTRAHEREHDDNDDVDVMMMRMIL